MKTEIRTEDKELILLKEPKNAGYYEFSAKDELVITNQYEGFTTAEATYAADNCGADWNEQAVKSAKISSLSVMKFAASCASTQ